MGRNSQRRRSARQVRAGHTGKPDLSEISRARTARALRADIATWLENPAGGPGGSFLEGENPPDPVAVWGVLTRWLVAAREHITADQARNAVDWISDAIGVSQADLKYAAGLIGHPESSPDATLNDAVEHYGGDPLKFSLYMLLLSGGLVATVGEGDPEWLRQFDLVGS